MVIIKIMGGLGNQLFQYALAEKMKSLGYEVKLDISYFSESIEGDTRRICYADLFPQLNVKYASYKEIIRCKEQSLPKRIKRKICRAGSSVYMEENCGFQQDIFQYKKRDDNYLIGYWQSEKYFKDIKETIQESFSLDFLLLSDRNAELKNYLEEEESVAVHIRGGDYLKKENNKIWGGICDKEYYRKSIDYMQEYLRNPVFYVFTNDMDHSEQILELERIPHIFVDWNSEEEGYIDLYLMSLCKHQIIANSSFSWWGAWLNKNNEKIVLVPDRWRNDENDEDIYCSGWLKI